MFKASRYEGSKIMKAARHAAILQLIENEAVETQEDLVRHLAAEGFDVTQATVSRDIKELRLIKVLTAEGSYKYATVDQAESRLMERFINIFSQSVLSIEAAGNLVIIKLLSGSANVAAEAIDTLHWKEIAGTIAGDNTIFVAINDNGNVQDVIRRFYDLTKAK